VSDKAHGRWFRVFAEHYDTLAAAIEPRRTPNAAAALHRLFRRRGPIRRILDVACGTGFLTRHLRGDVVGLDASARMLELARAQAPAARFEQGDALSLPFEDWAFDRVFTSYFYCHLEDEERERFLAEARRVAQELVVVASIRGDGDDVERWEERRLTDGSRWSVYKRVFEGPDLADELGGKIVFKGRWFVVVRA